MARDFKMPVPAAKYSVLSHPAGSSAPGFQQMGLLMFVLGAIASACGGGHGDDEHGEHGQHGEAAAMPSGAVCPSGSTLSYDNFGRAFMDMYCTRCHSSRLRDAARNGAPEGHDFDVYEGIIPVADHIDQYAAAGPANVNTKMPPNGPMPTAEERLQLGEWLACELQALKR